MFGTKMNVDPGPHTLEATAPGHEVWRTTVTIGEGGESRQVLVPALAVVATPSSPGKHPFVWTTQRIAGTAMMGVGVLGLAAGGALGGLALSRNNASKADCGIVHMDACNAAGVSLRNTAGTLADASTGTLVAGALVLAGGVVVFVTSRSEPGPKTALHRVELLPVAWGGTAGAVLEGEW
jgi:hypothetical protein